MKEYNPIYSQSKILESISHGRFVFALLHRAQHPDQRNLGHPRNGRNRSEARQSRRYHASQTRSGEKIRREENSQRQVVWAHRKPRNCLTVPHNLFGRADHPQQLTLNRVDRMNRCIDSRSKPNRVRIISCAGNDPGMISGSVPM